MNALTEFSYISLEFLANQSLRPNPTVLSHLKSVQTFRGFAGTSLLILVGVATDSARKVRSELVMESYDTKLDEFYSSKPKK